MKIVQDAFLRRTEELDARLGVGRSFDMVGRSLTVGGRRARLWVVNGYADDAVLERAISGWLPIRDLNGIGTLETFVAQYVTVSEAEAETDMDKAVTAVFSGKTLLVIAHRLNTIRGADQILVISDGEIAQRGTHQSLTEEDGIYRNFVTVRQQSRGWNRKAGA